MFELEQETRERMISAHAAEPSLGDAIPLLTVWRFPHLEQPDASWTFFSEKSGRNIVRVVEWMRLATRVAS